MPHLAEKLNTFRRYNKVIIIIIIIIIIFILIISMITNCSTFRTLILDNLKLNVT